MAHCPTERNREQAGKRFSSLANLMNLCHRPHLRLAAALQLLHWAAIKLGSRSNGLQPSDLRLASTLLWACTRRGVRQADQSWWQLEHCADTCMLPPRPCWLPDDTASEAKAMSEVAGHLLHTICSSHEEQFRPARLAVMHGYKSAAV